MKSTILFLLLILSCTGCATTPRQIWYQPGKTPQEAWQAYRQSQSYAARTPYPVIPARQRPQVIVVSPYSVSQPPELVDDSAMWNSLAAARHRRDFMNTGMRSQGYQPADPSTIPNGSQYPPTP